MTTRRQIRTTVEPCADEWAWTVEQLKDGEWGTVIEGLRPTERDAQDFAALAGWVLAEIDLQHSIAHRQPPYR